MNGNDSLLLSCNSHLYNDFGVWWFDKKICYVEKIIILKMKWLWWLMNVLSCVGCFLDSDLNIAWLGECVDNERWRMIVLGEPWWW